MINQGYEHITDDTTAPQSEDKKGDGNNTSENTESSGNVAISTPGTDGIKQNIRTAGMDIGPAQNAAHVYQSRDSLVKRPWTVVKDSHHEVFPGHIERPRSTSFCNGLYKKQAHHSSHHITSKMDNQPTIIGHIYSNNQLDNIFCTKRALSAVRAVRLTREAR